MPLHIEITGDCSPAEWNALAALVAVMGGRVAPTMAFDAPVTAADATMPEIVTLSEDVLAKEAERVAAAAPVPAPPPPNPGNVEVDATGLPWDARIHAGSKTKKADKTWTLKRGVEKKMVEDVTAELRAVMAVPSVPTPPPPPPPPADLDPAAAFPAPTPEPAAVVPEAAPPEMSEFTRIMRVVVAKQAAGVVTTALVTQIAQQLGLTGLPDFAKRPDLIPAFEAMLPA